MDSIPDIALSDLKVVENWVSAHYGTLLQLGTTHGDRLIGMRAAVTAQGNNTKEGVLVLSQTRFGEFLDVTSEEIEPGPAINVSDLLEFSVWDPVAFDSEHSTPFANGSVWRSKTANPVFYLATTVAADTIIRAYFCFHSEDTSHPAGLGRAVEDFPTPDFHCISPRMMLKQKGAPRNGA